MNRTTRPILSLGLLLASGLCTGCASEQALRQSLEQRDAMIRDLRDEKAALQEELQLVAFERDDLSGQLAVCMGRVEELASMEPVGPQPASAPTVAFPDLEQHGITVGRRGDAIVLSIPSAVSFSSGSAQLSETGRKALMDVARRLRDDFPADTSFFVEGHTDSDPIRRSQFDSNRALSLARALSVHGFLVNEGKLPDRRFVIVGHGQYRPADPGDSKDAKARNRRVEIVVRRDTN